MNTFKYFVPELTVGAIDKLINGVVLENVILQMLGYKKISTDRYRLLLNDGITTSPNVLLATNLNPLIDNRDMEKFCIFKLKNYRCNTVSTQEKVIICLGIDIIVPGSEVNRKINIENRNCKSGLMKSDGPNPEMDINISNNWSASTSRSGEQNILNVKNENVFVNKTEMPSTSYSPNLNNKFSVLQSTSMASTDNLISTGDMYHLSAGSSNTHINKQSQRNTQMFYPIQSLTPYLNKWIIKARVTFKSEIINYSNVKGEGKFFSFYLLDETGEIKSVVFNDCVDKFYNIILVNYVYFISNANVRLAREEPKIVKNDYEISCNIDTKIELCQDDTSDVPMLKFNFIPILKIEGSAENTYVDVIGVCNSISDSQTISAKSSNREVLKRDVQIVDESAAVFVTLWGNEAKNFSQSGIVVMALKGAKVVTYNKLTLSVTSNTLLFMNPDVEEAHKLRSWYEKLKKYEFNSISRNSVNISQCQNWKILSEINDISDLDDKTYYFTAKATIVLVHKEKCMYKACASIDCSKKVLEMPNGLYRCDKCNREYNNFQWTLMLNANIADFSNDISVVAFKEKAETILGIGSEELISIKERDEDEFIDTLSDAHFKTLIFKLCSKMEMFNERSQLKTIVISSSPLEPIAYGYKLLSDIKQMEKIIYK